MNGLDEASVAKVKNILLDYKKTGKTVILASHHKDDINELCDKVYEMNEGRVIPEVKIMMMVRPPSFYRKEWSFGKYFSLIILQ